jgi:predicted nucleotidyltransferase
MITEAEQTLLRQAIQELPYPPLFVTVSGAHLYGFASPDSDFDLRGAFVLPLDSVLGLDQPQETVTRIFEHQGREMDLAAHDVKKFLNLLLNKNGYVLEQLYSPLVVHGGVALQELQELGQGCITRHAYHHYQGFARSQVQRFESQSPRQAKTLLYIYRVLLTGIWLLETGQVEANLPRLNESFRLPFIPDLIAQKSREHAALGDTDLELHRATIAGLQARLEQAFLDSSLPEAASNRPALNDFLVRVRLELGK